MTKLEMGLEPLFDNALIVVAGGQDAGKTTFALSAGPSPVKMALFDNDIKAKSIVKAMLKQDVEFGVYEDLTKLQKGLKPVEFHNVCLELIENIPNGIELLIWDNFRPFEDTFHPVVQADPKRFRDKYSAMGQIKGAQEWIESFNYESQVLSRMLEKVKMVIITIHLKKQMLNGVYTGKRIPGHKDILAKNALLRIWLRHHPVSPVPIGLILKRPSKYAMTENGLEITNVLPRRMPKCTWNEIRKFWNDPIGNDEPEDKKFIATASEVSMMNGTLTEDEREVYEAGARIVELEKKIELAKGDPKMAAAIKLRKDNPNLSLPKIRKLLKEEGFTTTIPELADWIN